MGDGDFRFLADQSQDVRTSNESNARALSDLGEVDRLKRTMGL
jgi:hypothetical protein